MKLIVRDANFIDVKTGSIVTGRSLVVVNGVIADVTSRPGRGESVSMNGGFVLPGLMDAHVHLVWEGQSDPNRHTLSEAVPMTAFRAARSAWRNLCGGVSFVRDVGGPHQVPVSLARAVDAGIVDGCGILAAGAPVCQTGGHVHTMCREADGPDEVRKAVREQIKSGAHLVKLMCSGGAYTEGESIHAVQFTVDEIRAAVEEAHVSERRTAVHALPEQAIQNCLEAGADTIEHAVFLSDRNIETFCKTNAFMVPTLAPYYLMAVYGLERGVPEYAVEKSRDVMEHYADSLHRADSAGVRLALGTDAGSPGLPHPAVPFESWLWTAVARLEPLTVLRAATWGSARALGLEGKAGHLDPGCAGDFVAYGSNPLEDITVLHAPRAVFKAGRRVAGGSSTWSQIFLGKNKTRL